MNLPMQIILQKPPVGVVFGLQKGTGNQYQIIQAQTAALNDLVFEFDIEIKGAKENNELPDFKGPFVQGPKLGRFIYIAIGAYAQDEKALVGGRMKIPLTGITWQMIDGAADYGLQTQVPGTSKNGGPNYATVKPFEGWSIKKS